MTSPSFQYRTLAAFAAGRTDHGQGARLDPEVEVDHLGVEQVGRRGDVDAGRVRMAWLEAAAGVARSRLASISGVATRPSAVRRKPW
jgi:hypothetical protein